MHALDLIIQVDEEEPEAAEILVDGTVGDRPYPFLLDTGAARSRVVWDEYTAAFESLGQHSSAGVFAASSRDLITVPWIQFGPISAHDFTLTRTVDPNHEMRNLIGMDLLKDHGFHFLFDENRALVDPQPRPTQPLQDLFLGSKFHPYVDVSFSGQPAGAVWDTGAGMTVVDLGLVERHPGHFQPVGQSSGTDSTGVTTETPMYQMTAAVIGGHTFPPHRVAAVNLSLINSHTEAPVSLIIGYSTMRRANWWFDFPGRQWGITRML